MPDITLNFSLTCMNHNTDNKFQTHMCSDFAVTPLTLDLRCEGLLFDGVDSFSECEFISCQSDCEGPMGLNWQTSNQTTVGGLMVCNMTLFRKKFILYFNECTISFVNSVQLHQS